MLAADLETEHLNRFREISQCSRIGAGEGTRTPGPIITNDVLYQLSYTGSGSN